ncbi:hypothetical protein HanRHA438_Chr09g0409871 [Helianthus annuus]|nr:hypothetical protein HanRHA438_Chr09g0409871 [Helianthus annuus]
MFCCGRFSVITTALGPASIPPLMTWVSAETMAEFSSIVVGITEGLLFILDVEVKVDMFPCI